ncbi:hypothetical protein DFH09DRAFT_999707 [Mycena vulgaris]|nr:hypothetical protein DFH09DRAFT_999707 [Mycena vulgaris]
MRRLHPAGQRATYGFGIGYTHLRHPSGVFRKDRTNFELSDTNMLVEAWHHILKSIDKHLQGKRGRRVDHLTHTLINVALPHNIANHRAQKFGFQGPDLEVRERMLKRRKSDRRTSKRSRPVTSSKFARNPTL